MSTGAFRDIFVVLKLYQCVLGEIFQSKRFAVQIKYPTQ